MTVNDEGTNYFNLFCSGAGGAGSQEVVVVGVVPQLTLASDHDVTGVGGTAKLSWSSQNASTCIASGAWSGSKAMSGSESVAINTIGSHSFTLTCSDGINTVVQSISVTGSAPVVSLSVFPPNVVAGKTVTVRWRALYASSCAASGAWSGSQAVDGFKTITMSAQGSQNFRLSCSNAGATIQSDTTAVVAAAPAFPAATAYRMNESHDGVAVTASGAQAPPNSAPLWTANFSAPISYPLIAGGMVFVATANPDSSYGNRLYALNAKTGATVWGPVAVPGTYFGSGLSYDNGRIFILMFDGAVRAFNASNGAALWNTQLPGYWYMGSPNAYGGIVFIVGNAGLSAVDESNGEILWTTNGGATDFVSPAVSSEGAYFMDAYNCGAFGSEPLSGQQLWYQQVDCGGSFGYTPAVKNGLFYGRASGAVNLLDALTGAQQGQLASALAPAITDTAFIALNSGTLSATRLSDRAPIWNFTGDGYLVTAPVVVDKTVYVGSSAGKVYGVNAETGVQTWVGTSPLAINEDSENGGPMPPSGPAAGESLLIFPAGNSLVAWEFK